MNWCPQCGRPKEWHVKETAKLRSRKDGGCRLRKRTIAEGGSHHRGIPVYRADDKAYRKAARG